MQTNNPEIWDQLYSNEDYVFSTSPNIYLASKLALLPPGKLLLPGDGEGRNAVYAAQNGWEVDAFDLSEVGMEKALNLAKRNKVPVHFSVSDVNSFEFSTHSYDALGLVFVHFMPEERRVLHQKLSQALKKGGYLILTGFSRLVGVPANITFELSEIREDFKDFEWIECKKEVEVLNEGRMIQGVGEVVKIFAKKI